MSNHPLLAGGFGRKNEMIKTFVGNITTAPIIYGREKSLAKTGLLVLDKYLWRKTHACLTHDDLFNIIYYTRFLIWSADSGYWQCVLCNFFYYMCAFTKTKLHSKICPWFLLMMIQKHEHLATHKKFALLCLLFWRKEKEQVNILRKMMGLCIYTNSISHFIPVPLWQFVKESSFYYLEITSIFILHHFNIYAMPFGQRTLRFLFIFQRKGLLIMVVYEVVKLLIFYTSWHAKGHKYYHSLCFLGYRYFVEIFSSVLYPSKNTLWKLELCGVG